MKNIIFIMALLLLSIGIAGAVTQDELNEAKMLIDSNISCSKLNPEQLELIGEYYMEQMMPGQAHLRVHEMMGLAEGSADDEQFHINLARRTYCGENVLTYGMMGSRGNIGTIGMMGSNMMGYYPFSDSNYGSYGSGYNNFGFFWVMIIAIFTATLIGLILWLIYRRVNFMEQNKNTWILIFAVLALTLLFGGLTAGGMMGYGMGFGMAFGFIFMLFFLGLIIWLIITLINANQSIQLNNNESKRSDSLTILKKRYASGEITKKQFEEMKNDLKGE